jgi:hypothetical protein
VTEVQVVDFSHVTTSLWAAAEALFADAGAGRRPWVETGAVG